MSRHIKVDRIVFATHSWSESETISKAECIRLAVEWSTPGRQVQLAHNPDGTLRAVNLGSEIAVQCAKAQGRKTVPIAYFVG
jgi:hypothetical protein